MPTNLKLNLLPMKHLETHGKYQNPGSSFEMQAQATVSSGLPSMTDTGVPKTGDEPLPSSGGRPQHGPKVSKFVVFARKLYRPLGFHKGYNVPLFMISAGAMLGFTLAKLSNPNISGSSPGSFKSEVAPGEWFYLSHGIYRFGITLHLATVLPSGLLMVWQFVPFIRKRYYTFHRINGYTVMILIVLSNIGALMIARRSFGGGLDIQSAVGALVLLVTTSLALGLWNIWRLQIDQHRAWMLRAVFYMGTIITTRVIQTAAAAIVSKEGGYYQIQTCDQVASIFGASIPPPAIAIKYLQCLNASVDLPIPVNADFYGSSEQIGASLSLAFGMALWMSILLHVVGVEIYLNLTPAESTRLRSISYERQLECGLPHPGSAGITSDRWGDAPAWVRPERTDRIQSIVRVPASLAPTAQMRESVDL